MKKLNRLFFVILFVAIVICVLFLVYQLSQAEKITVKRSDRPLIEPNATQIPIDPNDPIVGNQGAPITLTAFIDFNDADNRELYRTISDFVTVNPTQIRMVFKDFPDTGLFAEDDIKPHIAAYCAKKQNKFIQFANEITAMKGKITGNETLLEIAGRSGLQTEAWQACFSSSEAKTRIESSISLAKAIGLKKAPVIFVNNMLVNYIDEINMGDLLTELINKY